MRPFLSLSIPEVPSYSEFAALASLPIPDGKEQSRLKRPTAKASSEAATELAPEAFALLDSATNALNNARKEWEAVSKASPNIARTTTCEEWWRADVKNVLRACIAASIAVGIMKKAAAALGTGKKMKDALKVEVRTGDDEQEPRGYHAFWVVPTVVNR